MTRHLWAPGGNTSCCDRPKHELPFGETMTADPQLVTCEAQPQ